MTNTDQPETFVDQLETPSVGVPSGLSEKSQYGLSRDRESARAQMPPLLDQLQKLGFTDRQMRTLARLSPETQEEVYTAVVTMLMSDDPVLEDILGWI